MASVFAILPTIILIVYPSAIFQRCLSGLPIRWQIVMRVVLDSIQGCYKNDAEPGTRDYRCFACVPYLFRLSPYLLLATSTDLDLVILLFIMITALVTILVILTDPYLNSFKDNSYHLTLSLSLMSIYGLLYAALAFRSKIYSEANFVFIWFVFFWYFCAVL